MNCPEDPRNRGSREAYGYQLESMMAAYQYSGIPYDPHRRIHNQGPARNLDRSFVPGSGHVMPRELNNRHPVQRRGAESVMIFSMSESESDDDGYSEYTDDQTTYSYTANVDYEVSAANFNCMNALFDTSKNHHVGLIQCHRVGPGKAEVQLNIPLPSQYMKLLDDAGGKGGSHKILNCAPSQYNPTLVEDSVLEIDPYKQYRERIAPQFFASLMESDGDDSASNDDYSAERRRDDSQIFGEFDAHRTAAQQALYNQLVLQNYGYAESGSTKPPEQIYVTESSSTIASGIENTAIELSLNLSPEVFSQPLDRQMDSSNHLREPVRVLKTGPPVETPGVSGRLDAVPITDQPGAATNHTNMTPYEEDDVFDQDGASIVSFTMAVEDGTGEVKEICPVRPKNKYLEQFATRRVSDEKPRETKTRVDEPKVVDDWSKISSSNEYEEPGRLTPQTQDTSGSESTFEAVDLSEAPSIEEPGRITPQSQGTSVGQHFIVTAGMVTSPGTAKHGQVDLDAAEKQRLSRRALAAKKFASMVIPSFEETPRRSIKPRMGARLPAIEEQDWTVQEDEDSPHDENTIERMKGIARHTKDDMKDEPKRIVRNMTLQALLHHDEPIIDDSRDEVEDDSRSPRNYSGPGVAALAHKRSAVEPFLISSNRANVASPRFANRSILEETSKANARMEFFDESSSDVERRIRSRELRKNRIRGMEVTSRTISVSAPLAEVPCGFERNLPSDHSTSSFLRVDEFLEARDDIVSAHRAGGDAPRDDQFRDPPPDLEDLLEFHSCDEDFFTNNTGEAL